MKKFIKLFSIVMIVCLLVFAMVACDNNEGQGDGNGDGDNNYVHIDYVSQLKLDMTSTTAKQSVTVKLHIDGDTVHFHVPTSIRDNGVLKGRFLAVNTPESTGKIENYGHTASRFTKQALLDATSIIIESDNETWNLDSTGDRHLVWVWYKKAGDADYRNLNLELLQNGLAIASSTANNRYGTIAMNALNQAKAEKLYVHSGVNDPEVYRGDAVAMTLKELRTNIASYNGIKVAVEGVVILNSDLSAYIEAYDEETNMYYGISAYYGHDLGQKGVEILRTGNKVNVVGTVQYWEGGGTYQLSDLQYRELKPNDPNNVKLISEGHSASYTLVDADTFKNGKVSIETEVEEEIVTTEYDFAELMLNASIRMENLTITSIYTTNNGGDNDGAMSFTCRASDGTIIKVRTSRIYDENGVRLTADDFEGKTISVKGLVDYYEGDYQINVYRTSDITIVE